MFESPRYPRNLLSSYQNSDRKFSCHPPEPEITMKSPLHNSGLIRLFQNLQLEPGPRLLQTLFFVGATAPDVQDKAVSQGDAGRREESICPSIYLYLSFPHPDHTKPLRVKFRQLCHSPCP